MKGRITLRTIKPSDSQHLSELKSKFELILSENKTAGESIDLRFIALSELVLDINQRLDIMEERLNESLLSRLWREIKQRVRRCLQFTNTSVSVEEDTKDIER